MNISLAPYHHTRLPQRPFAPTSVHLLSHSSAPMPPPQRTFAPFIYSDAPILPVFSSISTEETPHRSAPPRHFIYSDAPIPPTFPLFLLRNRPTAAHLSPHFSAPMPQHQRTFVLFSTIGTERFSHTNKSLIPCRSSGCTEVSGKSL